ncbi:hypothetical protein FGADI_2323 [Fusarium gaditjirri]|uniref:Uncharacterized protein n=1 Tax=Fusarium gaditjirri TaxID=282569 RepID=A0A8H4TII7_9HYPO|nr:hypothetical protein FGADI_2323 [Fusarium gaditjirri]
MFSAPSSAAVMAAQNLPLNPSKIPPGDICQRRAWLDGFLQLLGSDYTKHIVEERMAAQQLVIDTLVSQGARQIGAGFFEYTVDKNAWIKIFKQCGANVPWPWKYGPKRGDMSDGLSLVYNQWRVDHDLPVDEPEQ